jgi:hypothetical protein
MLNSLSIDAAAMRRLAEEQLFNARPIGSALFNPFVCRGDGRTGEITSWACLPEARTDDLVGRLLPSHALTLIVKRGLRPLDRVCVCACTHYLVFKEPTARRSLGSPGALSGRPTPAADSPAAPPLEDLSSAVTGHSLTVVRGTF